MVSELFFPLFTHSCFGFENKNIFGLKKHEFFSWFPLICAPPIGIVSLVQFFSVINFLI